MIHWQPAGAAEHGGAWAMAKHREEESDDEGEEWEWDEDRTRVDLPQWTSALIVVMVSFTFGLQVWRGHVDGEMYGLIVLVAGAALGVKAWRGRNV